MLALFSAKQLAAICCVTEKTAQRWKARRQTPRAAHLELITLHAAGRVIPVNWQVRIDVAAKVVELYDGGHRLRLVDLLNYWINIQRPCYRPD